MVLIFGFILSYEYSRWFCQAKHNPWDCLVVRACILRIYFESRKFYHRRYSCLTIVQIYVEFYKISFHDSLMDHRIFEFHYQFVLYCIYYLIFFSKNGLLKSSKMGRFSEVKVINLSLFLCFSRSLSFISLFYFRFSIFISPPDGSGKSLLLPADFPKFPVWRWRCFVTMRKQLKVRTKKKQKLNPSLICFCLEQ